MLAMVTLLVGATIPRGFMPERGQDGFVRIMLCTGNGPATLLVPTSHYAAASPGQFQHDRQEQKQDQQNQDFGHHGIICPYAGALAPLMMPDDFTVVLSLIALASIIAGRIRLSITPGRALAAPPPPSQAPPVSLF